MIFNSLTFLCFLAVVVSLYWLTPNKVRIWLIFISSLVFYGFWKWEFLSIVLLSTVTDYLIALEMNTSSNINNNKKRKKLLYGSLFVNLSLLFYFKYLFFFTESMANLGQSIGLDINGPTLNIILPLGISFYTFQTISYSVDVYRRHTEPIRDFALYGSYVTFFPQLVAGPVLRAEEVVGQLRTRATFNIDFIVEGVKRILYGLFLKVVLADNIAPLVDAGFSLDIGGLSALDAWSLAFLFGFQIYFDFAGYSHIAIGCAKLMGINFPENFNFPYAAKSFKSFWKRWHISLSSWIRDYLYLPLLGSIVIDPKLKSEGGIAIQTSGLAKTRTLFTTWAIMGLWHGANWTFVLWGVYHATMIYLERLFRPIRQKLGIFNHKMFTWALTFPLVMLGWIPFRTESLSDAVSMMSKVFNPKSYLFYTMRENVYLITFTLCLLVTASFLLAEWKSKIKLSPLIMTPLRVAQYTTMFVLVYTFFRPISQFIYFQF